jgi:hypothetical protein
MAIVCPEPSPATFVPDGEVNVMPLRPYALVIWAGVYPASRHRSSSVSHTGRSLRRGRLRMRMAVRSPDAAQSVKQGQTESRIRRRPGPIDEWPAIHEQPSYHDSSASAQMTRSASAVGDSRGIPGQVALGDCSPKAEAAAWVTAMPSSKWPCMIPGRQSAAADRRTGIRGGSDCASPSPNHEIPFSPSATSATRRVARGSPFRRD